MATTTLKRQLEDLQMLSCSLMPGERLDFALLSDKDATIWQNLLRGYPDIPADVATPDVPAVLKIRVDNSRVWLEASLPHPSHAANTGVSSGTLQVSVKGSDITRREHERWQQVIKEHLDELNGSEYPLYELMSTRLLPLLHEEAETNHVPEDPEIGKVTEPLSKPIYHALFTSHHLVSTTKRRNMQQWSSQLNITGYAKVGYPGIIYCEGVKEDVEEFVSNVKAMQWLALRLRFLDSIPGDCRPTGTGKRQWEEFQKVGDVVEEMRRIGREKFIVEMGIGSSGTNVDSSATKEE